MSSERGAYTWFSIGGILSDTIEVIGDNFAKFASIALLGQLPAIVFNLLFASARSTVAEFRISFGYTTGFHGNAAALEVLVAVASFSIAQGALTIGVVTTLEGQRATLASSLTAALKSALSLSAITILFFLGTVVGLVLLIAPGIALAIGWIVATPVHMIERRSVFESLYRSWTMTKDHRWAILGTLMIAAIAGIILLIVVMLVGGSLATAAGGNAGAAILWTMSVFAGCFISVFSGTLVGVIYYELYFIKEGRAPALPSLASE